MTTGFLQAGRRNNGFKMGCSRRGSSVCAGNVDRGSAGSWPGSSGHRRQQFGGGFGRGSAGELPVPRYESGRVARFPLCGWTPPGGSYIGWTPPDGGRIRPQ